MRLPDTFAETIIKLLKIHSPGYTPSLHERVASWAAVISHKEGKMVSEERIKNAINNPIILPNPSTAEFPQTINRFIDPNPILRGEFKNEIFRRVAIKSKPTLWSEITNQE